METVLASVARTSRLVVAHEAGREFGFGAEIAARVADEGFWTLDAPVGRVGTPRVPPPYAPELERAWLPGPSAIRDAVLKAVRV
jgi:2-oxoisovalerate dehydrogenase E1 component